jgi:hypothetical protein
MPNNDLGSQDTNTAGSLDLFFGALAKELGLDDERLLGQVSLAEHLEVAGLSHIDDGHLVRLGSKRSLAILLRDQRPQGIYINHRAMILIAQQMIVAHANLAKVSRMVLVKVDLVVMLATGVTATTWMLAVLANTTVTVANVTSQLSRLFQFRYPIEPTKSYLFVSARRRQQSNPFHTS